MTTVVFNTGHIPYAEWLSSHLSTFGLVLHVVCGADLGLDVLEVGQRLVKDAELFGSGGR